MKQCKKCRYENPNSANVCEKCYSILDDEISEETSETFFKGLERKKFRNLLTILYWYCIS